MKKIILLLLSMTILIMATPLGLGINWEEDNDTREEIPYEELTDFMTTDDPDADVSSRENSTYDFEKVDLDGSSDEETETEDNTEDDDGTEEPVKTLSDEEITQLKQAYANVMAYAEKYNIPLTMTYEDFEKEYVNNPYDNITAYENAYYKLFDVDDTTGESPDSDNEPLPENQIQKISGHRKKAHTSYTVKKTVSCQEHPRRSFDRMTK